MTYGSCLACANAVGLRHDNTKLRLDSSASENTAIFKAMTAI